MAEKNVGRTRSNMSLFRKWKDLILEKVRAIEIVRIMAEIPDEIKKEVENLEHNKCTQDSTSKLLTFLMEEERKNIGMWKKFLDALTKAGYPYVCKVIQSDMFVREDEYKRHQRRLKEFLHLLGTEVDPKYLMDHCYEKDLIVKEDMHKIENECKNHTPGSGMSVMLDRIPRRAEDWFYKFLNILFINKYEFVVENIDLEIHEVLKENLPEEEFIERCKHIERKKNTPMETDEDTSQNIQSHKRRRTTESEDDSGIGMQYDIDDEISMNEVICDTNEDMPRKLQKIDSSNEIKQELTLRDYQHELAELAIQGKNDLIVAPTGSGKTHVAIRIIQDHFDKNGDKGKVAFLVDKTALANQQCTQIRKYLNHKVKEITGDTQKREHIDTVPLSLKNADILVMTAQILVNALETKSVNISDFTLLVFDECHHATQNHAYNQILHRYMDVKLSADRSLPRPQIVGLTASVGAGKAKNLLSTVQSVELFMANLDAQHISTVERHTEELKRFSVIPRAELHRTPGRKNKLFGETIQQLMKNIEKYMAVLQKLLYMFQTGPIITDQNIHSIKLLKTYEGVTKCPVFKQTLMKSVKKGTDPYTQWLSQLGKHISQTSESSARKCFYTCHYFLEAYHKTLMVYTDARVKDALVFLKEKVREWYKDNKLDETTQMIKQNYDGYKQTFEKCNGDPEQENPKLDKLQEILLKSYQEKGEMRAIVFVKTRNLASHLVLWMKETRGLLEFNPSIFVGISQNVSNGGLMKSDQKNILELFRSGGHKLIIATSVAEEGLDIPKCNNVIRYNHVTNEIAMTQSKGRCRAKDGTYTVIAGEDEKTENKEVINHEREAWLKPAIEEIQIKISDDYESFLANQLKIQKKEKQARHEEIVKNENKSVNNKVYKIKCKICHQELCKSSDLRKIEGCHHAVISPGIYQCIEVKEKEGYETENIKFIAVIICIKCKRELGKECTYKRDKYPLLSAKDICLVDEASGKPPHSYNKWKKYETYCEFSAPNFDKE